MVLSYEVLYVKVGLINTAVIIQPFHLIWFVEEFLKLKRRYVLRVLGGFI